MQRASRGNDWRIVMRFYFTTTVENTKQIWEHGFWDIYSEFGLEGVWFASQPLDANDGFPGEVVLCMEIPDNIFEQYEFDAPDHPYREAIIPATALNEIGKPQVFDHQFAGMSRRDLSNAANRWEERGVRGFLHADEFRSAMKFFDDIGWLTPLRLREQGTS
jgi:hypothetical protein